MKPLKERLPLIDDAIDELKEWPDDHHVVLLNYGGNDYLSYSTNSAYLGKFVCTRDEFNERKRERQNKPKWGSHKYNRIIQTDDGHWYGLKDNCTPHITNEWKGDQLHLLREECEYLQTGEVIGNWQDTLEQRPETEGKEQPMKYEYGIEYETNGEKPDLPDDVLVEYMRKDWKGWIGVDTAGAWRWKCCTSFRIVDQRYKPKEQDMNDWYEKGGLPPVDSECEVLYQGVWYKTKIVGHNGCYAVCVTDGFCYDSDYIGLSNIFFRPIRTETDELVDEAELDIRSLSPELDRQVIRKMIGAGYRKIKPMSEGEFVQDALKSFDSKRFEVSQLKMICESLRKLHRAGCRFLDKGE